MASFSVEEVQGKKCLIQCGRRIVEFVCVDVWYGEETERWMAGCMPRSLYDQGEPTDGWPESEMQYLRFSDAWMRVRRWRKTRSRRRREQWQRYERRLHEEHQPKENPSKRARTNIGKQKSRKKNQFIRNTEIVTFWTKF